MRLCPGFGNKDIMSPTHQVKFGEIQIITSPLPQKKSTPQIIKPTHQHHQSEPTNYINNHKSPTTPKQRMRDVGFKVEKNLNKALPPVPIRHLPPDTMKGYFPRQELKSSEFPRFGFRTGLDKLYKSSSTPHLNNFDSNSHHPKPILKNQARPDPSNRPVHPNTPTPVIPPRYNRNPPPPLNLQVKKIPQPQPPLNLQVKKTPQPQPLVVSAPKQTKPKSKPSTQPESDTNPSDLSQFISNFKNTLNPGEDEPSVYIHPVQSPTEFDWIKNMDNQPNHPDRQSFSIKGHSSDLSGFESPYSDSFIAGSISSPAILSPTADSDSHSDHSLTTPKDDTVHSPLSQTLDILCGGDSNHNSLVEPTEESIDIPLSDIARANLGKWSQLRERKLTRRGRQAAGVGSGSGQRIRFRDAHPTPVTDQSNAEGRNENVSFGPSHLGKKCAPTDSDLSYDLTGILDSYNYPRRRGNQGYEVQDDVSSILNFYMDPTSLQEPPALSTATSHDDDEEEDAIDTLDEVRNSLGLLERIHQGLKLNTDPSSDCEELGAGGDFIDLYFPDLVYCQNGSPEDSQHS